MFDMLEMKRLRLACLLRQIDVSQATGIAVSRLSSAERGLIRLADAEQRMVMGLLQRRWQFLGSFTQGSHEEAPTSKDLPEKELAAPV